MKKEEEYEVINISSSEFINQLDFLQDNYDIILVDFCCDWTEIRDAEVWRAGAEDKPVPMPHII